MEAVRLQEWKGLYDLLTHKNINSLNMAKKKEETVSLIDTFSEFKQNKNCLLYTSDAADE